MTPSGIIDNMANAAGNFTPKDDRMEKAMEQFAKDLGNITKDAASSVARLVESFEDSEDAMQQYRDLLQDCTDSISDMQDNLDQLNDDIVDITHTIDLMSDEAVNFKSELTNLNDELSDLVSNGASNDVIDAKQQEIAAKEAQIASKEAEILAKQKELAKASNKRDVATQDLQRGKDKRDRLTDAISHESRKQSKIDGKVQSVTGKDMSVAKAALQRRNAAVGAAPNGGGKMASMAKGLKGLKANPWMMAIDGLVQAIEFGIGKATEYARVNTENLLRHIVSSNQVALNDIQANLDSWQNAIEGAYSSQDLALESQQLLLASTNETLLATKKLSNTWTNWIPIMGAVNKYQEEVMSMEQKLEEEGLKIASQWIKQAEAIAKRTDDYISKQDNTIHSFQKDTGLSQSQTKVFEEYMLKTGVVLSEYNRTVEDALKMQTHYFETTGRTVNFTQDDYVQNAAVGQLVGDSNLANFQSQMSIFNHSVSDSADIMYQMYKDVNKMGLSQKKVTKDVLANLKLANKYNFREGTKSFIELAKWAENARFNLGALGGSLEKVQAGGLEGTITQAAKLQVLGGNFAMAADPLGMMWEADNDPDAYAKRIKDSFAGMGIVDQTTGETKFSGAEQRQIRAAAEAWGISMEDAKNMIREDNKKQVVRKQMGGSRLNPDQQDAVINKAQRDEKTGRWVVNVIGSDTPIDVSQVTEADLSNIVSEDNGEAAVQYAKSTLSVVEQIESTTKLIAASLGVDTFENYMAAAQQSIDATRDAYSQNHRELTEAIATVREHALEEQKKSLERLGIINTELTKSYGKLASVEEYNKRMLALLEAKYAHIKEARDRTEKVVQERLNPQYEKTQQASYGDRFSEGQKLQTRRKEYWYAKGDEDIAQGNYVSGYWNKFNGFAENTIGRAVQGVANVFGGVYDAVSSSDGKPSLIQANSITPIHDGSLQLAQTDAQDHAIFAKVGGPFDTLFNGIFGEISAIGDYVRDIPYRERGISDLFDMTGMTRPSIIPKPMVHTEVQPTAIPTIAAMIDNARNANANTCHVTFDRPLELNGSLTLSDGSGNQLDIVREFERNPQLLRQLTQMISEAISRNMNGGKAAYNGGQLVGGFGFGR